jgi:hypothetical protein
VEDAVGVDLEGDLDLRLAAGRGADAFEAEPSQDRLSAARSRSPWSTTMSTAVWFSSAVLNTSVRRAGMVVLRSMNLVITPPMVSTPSDSGGHVEEQDVGHLALDDRRLGPRRPAPRPRRG